MTERAGRAGRADSRGPARGVQLGLSALAARRLGDDRYRNDLAGWRGVVCEVAVVAGDGSILFHSLVNPERPVSAEAREIHGISDEELAAAPTLPEICPALQEALRDRTTLVAYNVAFDRARLAQSAHRYQLPGLTQEWECAMEAYAAFCGNWSDYHGSYTWIPLAGNHRAVGDALAALERVREMAAIYEHEYAPLLAEQEQS